MKGIKETPKLKMQGRRLKKYKGGFKQPAQSWLEESEYLGITIMDASGWTKNTDHWKEAWEEPITQEEFEARLNESIFIREEVKN